MKIFIYLLIITTLLTGCSKKENTKEIKQPEQTKITYTFPNEYEKRPISDITKTYKVEDNKNIEITESGIYKITGESENTEIIINVSDKDVVELVLSNVKITNKDKSVITITKTKETLITLDSKTNNSFTTKGDTESVINSESIINIGGSGTLNFNSNKKGIVSTKDIIFENGKVNITSKGDSIKSDGAIYFLDGTFNLSSNRDNIDTEKALLIKKGTFKLTTIKETKDEDDESRKGLKAEELIKIENGIFEINTFDDGMHSNNDLEINNGEYNIKTQDDGIHADNNLTLNNGTYNIIECREGIEGTIVTINDGSYKINSSDDSINSKAGTEEAEKTQKRNGNELVKMIINGGTITAIANGDVLDSNGDIYINGGNILLHGPSGSPTEGAIMASGTEYFKGGTMSLISLVGTRYTADTQPIIFISFVEEQKSGTKLIIKDENNKVINEIKTKHKYYEATFTSPELEIGKTYTIYQNDKKLIDVTLSKTITKKGADGKRYTGGYK